MSTGPDKPTLDSEQRRQFARYWMQAQPIVAAYIASGVRDRQHCEDLLQETAMAIAEAFDKYDPDKPFLTWAMAIARHKVLQYYRKHSRDRLVFDETLLEQIGTRMEDQADTARLRKAALSVCLEKLADSAREMIKLRYVQRLGYDKIAKLVGRTSAGVANNLLRSRKALAQCIKLEVKRSEGDER